MSHVDHKRLFSCAELHAGHRRSWKVDPGAPSWRASPAYPVLTEKVQERRLSLIDQYVKLSPRSATPQVGAHRCQRRSCACPRLRRRHERDV